MSIKSVLLVVLLAACVTHLAHGEALRECSTLPLDQCAFAVSDSGHRCVLEKQVGNSGKVCQTSTIMAGNEALANHIESDECVRNCGADRSMIGFASDGVYSASFAAKICSSQCRATCFNLVDLYSSIIAGEGVRFAEFCGERRRSIFARSRRDLSESPLLFPMSQRKALAPV